MRPTRYYSKKQEQSIERELRREQISTRRVANSGATPFHKGDVEADDFLIECKTAVSQHKASFSIKEDWLLKNKKEAFAMGKRHNALAFQFGEGLPNYYIIDEKQFKEYLFLLKEVSTDE